MLGAAATLSCFVILCSPQSGQLGFSFELRMRTSTTLSHLGQWYSYSGISVDLLNYFRFESWVLSRVHGRFR